MIILMSVIALCFLAPQKSWGQTCTCDRLFVGQWQEFPGEDLPNYPDLDLGLQNCGIPVYYGFPYGGGVCPPQNSEFKREVMVNGNIILLDTAGYTIPWTAPLIGGFAIGDTITITITDPEDCVYSDTHIVYANPLCSDGVLNGDEANIDCGCVCFNENECEPPTEACQLIQMNIGTQNTEVTCGGSATFDVVMENPSNSVIVGDILPIRVFVPSASQDETLENIIDFQVSIEGLPLENAIIDYGFFNENSQKWDIDVYLGQSIGLPPSQTTTISLQITPIADFSGEIFVSLNGDQAGFCPIPGPNTLPGVDQNQIAFDFTCDSLIDVSVECDSLQIKWPDTDTLGYFVALNYSYDGIQNSAVHQTSDTCLILGFEYGTTITAFAIAHMSSSEISEILEYTDTIRIGTGIDLKVFLEGTYDPAVEEMDTALNERGLLPGQTPIGLGAPTPAGQPYSIAPWNYSGTEGMGWTDADYSSNVVDWVLVSLRTAIEPTTKIAETAGLLMQNGEIQFPDECWADAIEDSVYIVIEHRNHIGVMTPQPVNLIGGTLTYDFRLQDSYRNPTSFGQKQLPTGEWAMYAGDADQSDFPSYDMTGADKSIWVNDNGQFDQYLPADLNLDGDVNGQDKAIWFENNGISSRVPK